MNDKIGYWAFIIGIVISILVGLFAPFIEGFGVMGWLPLVLVGLGLVVGLLNIGDKEINNFLIAVIAIAVVSSANISAFDLAIPTLGQILQAVVSNIRLFIMPAALVVALKAIYDLSSTPKIM